mgnify:CR=1 FL=1
MRIVFSSGISNLVEKNSSFDSGVLRVAYTGKNRNNSFISKETFERCMPSIYNCPIVCNYDRESDTIGSHDMELVSDDNGMRIVKLSTLLSRSALSQRAPSIGGRKSKTILVSMSICV